MQEQYGDYDFKFVLYAGRVRGGEEIRENLSRINLFGRPVELVIIRELLQEFINSLRDSSTRKSTYNNEIAISTLLALDEYDMFSDS